MGINAYNNNILGIQKPKLNINKATPGFRSQLAYVLFKKPLPESLTFGWSKQVTDIEAKILDTLTDPSVKSAIVAAHTRPDADAYGSNIGLSAILKSRGVNVQAIIDDKKPARFTQMPSPEKNVTATEFVKSFKELTPADVIKNPDVTIIADTGIPDLTTPDVIKALATGKTIIVIDHHGDSTEGPTNKEIWTKALVDQGADPNNILYWREERASAAEMVGELDREIAQEAKIKNIPGYDTNYYKGYRLAVAGGIIGDVGGLQTHKGNADNIKLARLSDKKVQSETGKFESITRNIFDWLVNTSGVKKSTIDMKSITRISLPEEVSVIIDDVIDGHYKSRDIDVKTATKDDPLAYLIIKNWGFFGYLSSLANKKSKGGAKITPSDIYKEVKKRVEEKIVLDNNVGLMLLGNEFKNNFSLSIRSYGYNALDGEAYQQGHVFTNALARKVVDSLINNKLGQGGGHDNATGFRSNDGVSIKEAMPIIESTLKEFIKDKDLRKVPQELQARIIKMPSTEKKLNRVG
jgi:nanoRNase/pAp phosphatase (c-di-AMP/oligoRNAs hydrolase)